MYIVKCQDGTYYTGYASDLEKRLKEHNDSERGAKYLRGKTPVRLAYAKEYSYYRNAVRAERDIKRLTRKRKEELMAIYEKTNN